MAKWVCTVCGYVYEGENPPAECPVCHVGADKFKKVEGDLTLAAEHEFGVYASTVKNNPEISDEDKKYIFEQLKANFAGECSTTSSMSFLPAEVALICINSALVVWAMTFAKVVFPVPGGP